MADRQIRRDPCNRCNGRGGNVSYETKTCEVCTGMGWVEDPVCIEKICPSCNGSGTRRLKKVTPCCECSGKGYLVRIIEIEPEEYECGQCEGSGRRPIPWSCSECQGIGVEIIRCELCNGSGSIDGFTCGHCLATGEVVGFSCEKCHGTGNGSETEECPICQGTGVLSYLAEKDVTPTGPIPGRN